MSVRLKRLRADAQLVQRCFAAHPHVRLVEAIGDPPERYRFELKVKGLVIRGGRSSPRTRTCWRCS